MGYTISSGDIIEYTVESRLEGQRCLNIYHYRYKDGQTARTDGGADLLSFLADQSTDVTGEYDAHRLAVTSAVQFVSLKAQVIYPTRRAYTAFVVTDAGARPGEPLPSGCAACLSLYQDTAGRGRTGRKEIAGMDKGDEGGGFFTPTALALINAIGSGHVLEKPIAGPGTLIEPILFNRTNPILSRRVTGYGARSTVRYLTRRTVGRGE